MSNFDLGAKRRQKQASPSSPSPEELRELAKQRAAKSPQRHASIRGFDSDHLMAGSSTVPEENVPEVQPAAVPTQPPAGVEPVLVAVPVGQEPPVPTLPSPAPVQETPVAPAPAPAPVHADPEPAAVKEYFTDAPTRAKFHYPVQPAAYFNPDPDWSSGFNGGLPERTTFRHSRYVKDWLQEARKEIERRNLHADSDGKYSRNAPRMTDSVLIRILIELGFAQLNLDSADQKIDETILREINSLPVSPDLEIYAEYQQSLPPEGQD